MRQLGVPIEGDHQIAETFDVRAGEDPQPARTQRGEKRATICLEALTEAGHDTAELDRWIVTGERLPDAVFEGRSNIVRKRFRLR